MWYSPSYMILNGECFVLSDTIEISLEGDMAVKETDQYYATSEGENLQYLSDEKKEEQLEKTWEWELVFSQEERKTVFFFHKEGIVGMTERTGDSLQEEIPWEEMVEILKNSRRLDRTYETTVKELRTLAVTGTIHVFTVPEEVWNLEEEGVRYLLVGDEGEAFRIYEMTMQDDMKRYFAKQAEEQ